MSIAYSKKPHSPRYLAFLRAQAKRKQRVEAEWEHQRLIRQHQLDRLNQRQLKQQERTKAIQRKAQQRIEKEAAYLERKRLNKGRA